MFLRHGSGTTVGITFKITTKTTPLPSPPLTSPSPESPSYKNNTPNYSKQAVSDTADRPGTRTESRAGDLGDRSAEPRASDNCIALPPRTQKEKDDKKKTIAKDIKASQGVSPPFPTCCVIRTDQAH